MNSAANTSTVSEIEESIATSLRGAHHSECYEQILEDIDLAFEEGELTYREARVLEGKAEALLG